MTAIAFFPWVRIAEPCTIGAIRLLPFLAGSQPGATAYINQSQIDGVLAAYSHSRQHPVTEAMLLEVGNWHLGMPLDDATVDELFRVRTAVVFSALSARSLFRGHFGYTNAQAYQLVVQRFDPDEPTRFAFITRRRDGGTSHVWAAKHFAFERPHQVAAHERFSLDLELLRALSQPNLQGWLYEALVEFNAANTDSNDIPEHVELVMSKTALEWLLQVGDKWQAFARAIRAIVPTQLEATGPLAQQWTERYPRAPDLLGAWAQEFSQLRNWSAHADEREDTQFVWRARQHLAFVSILIPLLVKRLLAVDGHYTLTAVDTLKLERISRLLVHDPFASIGDDDRHPWSEVDTNARMRVISFHLESADSGDTPST